MPILSKESRQRILDAKIYINKERVNFETFKAFLENEYDTTIIERTFERDIRELKKRIKDLHDDADKKDILTYDSLIKSYKYKNGYYAFKETPLSIETDLGKLLKYNRNFITDMETELNSQIEGIMKEYSAFEESKISWHPVAYQNKINEGQHNFTKVLNFIVQQIPVEIEYLQLGAIDSTSKNYILVLLKELDNNFAKGWYVLGQRIQDNDKEIILDVDKFNILALDRIVKIKHSKYKPTIQSDLNFDPKDYFKNTIKGLMRNNLNRYNETSIKPTWGEKYKANIYRGPEKVRLKIPNKTNWICKYFEKYPIHTSQKHSTDGHSFYIDLMVEVDLDLENLIFMYSKELIVVEPVYLRKNLIDRLKTALKNY